MQVSMENGIDKVPKVLLKFFKHLYDLHFEGIFYFIDIIIGLKY